MRLAVWHNAPPGGARRAITELVRELGRRHEVQLFQLGSRSDAPADLPVPIHVIPHAPRARRRGLFLLNDRAALAELRELDRLGRETAAMIDAGAFDAVLASVCRWSEAPAVLRYVRTPAAYFCQEPPRRFYEPWCRPTASPLTAYERARYWWQRPSGAVVDAVVKRHDVATVRAATRVLVNSEYSRHRVEQVYGRDAHVSYLGVDTEFFHPSRNGMARRGVISVGALEPHKGFDFVIRALGRLPPGRRPELTIVGGGGHQGMPRYLQGLAERAGLSVHVRSGLDDVQLRALYQASELFVFGAHQEPFGLVALEAMACGLPVVAVAEGGIPEIVRDGETGFLAPRDETALAEAVGGLLSRGEQREAMGRAARSAVTERWTWPQAADRLEHQLAAMIA